MSLRRLYDLDGSFPDRLDQLLHDDEYVGGLQRLPDPELFQLVDHLNEILVRLDRTGGSSRKCLRVLRKICSSRKVLPTTYELSRDLLPPSEPPKANGGFCDAYEGTISIKVCIKRLKVLVPGNQEKVKELFCKEAVVWKNLNHPNVVPFKGVTFHPLQLVSDWMPGGELRNHVKNNPEADLLSLLLGTAQGLAYLHSRGVIHGDLKGSNIMIDELGNPRITDFGLAKIIRGSNSLPSTSDGQSQTLRWTAPEISKFGKAASEESDVYSFAMVTIEVFTGDVPFKDFKSSEVVIRIIRGERPGRPSHPKFTVNLWELTQRCWTEVIEDRPKIENILKELQLCSQGVTENPITLDLHEPNPHSLPITSVDGVEFCPLPYVMDDSNLASELLPAPPPKDDGDGHLTHRPINGTKEGPPSERQPDSVTDASDRGPGGWEVQGGTSVAGVPPSGLPGPSSSASEQIKKHGMWCRVKNCLLYVLEYL